MEHQERITKNKSSEIEKTSNDDVHEQLPAKQQLDQQQQELVAAQGKRSLPVNAGMANDDKKGKLEERHLDDTRTITNQPKKQQRHKLRMSPTTKVIVDDLLSLNPNWIKYPTYNDYSTLLQHNTSDIITPATTGKTSGEEISSSSIEMSNIHAKMPPATKSKTTSPIKTTSRTNTFPSILHQMLDLTDRYPTIFYIDSNHSMDISTQELLQKEIVQQIQKQQLHQYSLSQDQNQTAFDMILESMGIISFCPSNILRWEYHGRLFIIIDKIGLVKYFFPLYFPYQTEYASFQRQLNLYGYIRLIDTNKSLITINSSQPPVPFATAHVESHDVTTTESHKVVTVLRYYHEKFLRTRPDLCTHMLRTYYQTATAGGSNKKSASSILSTASRLSYDPGTEPNFDSFPPLLYMIRAALSTNTTDVAVKEPTSKRKRSLPNIRFDTNIQPSKTATATVPVAVDEQLTTTGHYMMKKSLSTSSIASSTQWSLDRTHSNLDIVGLDTQNPDANIVDDKSLFSYDNSIANDSITFDHRTRTQIYNQSLQSHESVTAIQLHHRQYNDATGIVAENTLTTQPSSFQPIVGGSLLQPEQNILIQNQFLQSQQQQLEQYHQHVLQQQLLQLISCQNTLQMQHQHLQGQQQQLHLLQQPREQQQEQQYQEQQWQQHHPREHQQHRHGQNLQFQEFTEQQREMFQQQYPVWPGPADTTPSSVAGLVAAPDALSLYPTVQENRIVVAPSFTQHDISQQRYSQMYNTNDITSLIRTDLNNATAQPPTTKTDEIDNTRGLNPSRTSNSSSSHSSSRKGSKRSFSDSDIGIAPKKARGFMGSQISALTPAPFYQQPSNESITTEAHFQATKEFDQLFEGRGLLPSVIQPLHLSSSVGIGLSSSSSSQITTTNQSIYRREDSGRGHRISSSMITSRLYQNVGDSPFGMTATSSPQRINTSGEAVHEHKSQGSSFRLKTSTAKLQEPTALMTIPSDMNPSGIHSSSSEESELLSFLDDVDL